MTTTGSDDPAATRPGRRVDARLNRERLVAAARDVFAEAGPQASLNEIARRAGVGPGTLYRHFPNRSALLAAVLMDRIEALCGQAEHLTATAAPDEALAHWLHAFLDHARASQAMAGALLTEDQDGAPETTDCHRLILDAAAAVLTRAQRQGSARPDLTADDLVQLTVGVALSTAHRDDEERPARLLALILDAAHAPPRG
ncbi:MULTISPECIES: TetR/AcrR family transcriptional regulator [Streptomyces]|uniref:TetR/AcrR family transcriptional regulator n=1 Tax=Streptomyces venezuelae TaxID=54571 RepID=A0A5P2ARM3_STRVZ|nr:TetR/AcrR family transcriptional regulator [Streptomyces venezuelae]QES20686.1 TetR/AcrR family transcriptional regulator [Streptomyces venezuelae]